MIDKVDLSESLNVKGKVKLELFDAKTNQVVNKVEGENFIAKSVREQLFKMAMANLFWKSKESGGSSRDLPALFDKVLLTDFDGSEAPNTEWSVRGNWTGIASTTKVGTATAIEGVYNKDESFTQGNQVRVVIDFPTSSANGVINSVYFLGDFLDTDFHKYLPEFAPELEKSNRAYDLKGLIKYKNLYYAIVERTIYVFDENQKVKREETLDSGYVNPIAYNDYIYVTYGRDVYKSKIEDLKNWSKVQTLKDSDVMVFNSSLTQFVNLYEARGKPIRDMYDKDFKLLSSKELVDKRYVRQSISVASNGYHVGGNDYIISPENRSGRELSISGDAIYSHELMPNIDYNSKQRKVGVFNEACMLADWTLAPKQGFSSRFKLPSSVIKTELNTMKLTYDFILPEIVSLED